MPAPDPETAFEMALARAGIVVPPDRRPVMFEGFLAWRALRDVLDEPMPRITEPAFGLRQPRTPPGCARPAIRACCRRNGQARTPRRRRASKPPAWCCWASSRPMKSRAADRPARAAARRA